MTESSSELPRERAVGREGQRGDKGARENIWSDAYIQ